LQLNAPRLVLIFDFTIALYGCGVVLISPGPHDHLCRTNPNCRARLLAYFGRYQGEGLWGRQSCGRPFCLWTNLHTPWSSFPFGLGPTYPAICFTGSTILKSCSHSVITRTSPIFQNFLLFDRRVFLLLFL
jgi:hypothetical protein